MNMKLFFLNKLYLKIKYFFSTYRGAYYKTDNKIIIIEKSQSYCDSNKFSITVSDMNGEKCKYDATVDRYNIYFGNNTLSYYVPIDSIESYNRITTYKNVVKISSEEYYKLYREANNKAEEIKKNINKQKEIDRRIKLLETINEVIAIDGSVEVINLDTMFKSLLENTFNRLKHPNYSKDGKYIIDNVVMDLDFNVLSHKPNSYGIEIGMTTYLEDLKTYNTSTKEEYIHEIVEILKRQK